jgi:STE24 endopeptidase
MQPTTLFYILIGIIIISFIIDKFLDVLNTKHFDDKIPKKLADVYDATEYKKSQKYKKTNAKFSNLTSTFSILLTLGFFFIDGFKHTDDFARSFTENPILVALIFFGIIILGSDILTTPFSYYKTFVIEEKFGFNKSTKKTFWLDKIKGWLMSSIIGGGILALIIWFYQLTGYFLFVYEYVLRKINCSIIQQANTFRRWRIKICNRKIC